MSKKTVIVCIMTIIMIAYYCYALPLTWGMASEAHLKKGVDIFLTDTTSKFVNRADVLDELGIDADSLPKYRISTFDLGSLEKKLRASDKLQAANVSLMADGRLVVDVEPMIPVARVFDTGKPSYYINATGKRISAELRYSIDLPAIVGTFSREYPPERLIPLLDYISSDKRVNALVATVTQEADGNIIIVPSIVGHVINFGDTTQVADKFARLRAFYRHVMPTKGWLTYDTISVKWRDRVVATRRLKEAPKIAIPTYEDETGILDIDDNEPSPDDISPEIIEEQKKTLP